MSANDAWVRRQGRSAEYRSELLPIDETALQDTHDSARPCPSAAR